MPIAVPLAAPTSTSVAQCMSAAMRRKPVVSPTAPPANATYVALSYPRRYDSVADDDASANTAVVCAE